MTRLDQSVFEELEEMSGGIARIATEMGLNPDLPWRSLVNNIVDYYQVLKTSYDAVLYDDWETYDELYPYDDSYDDDTYEEGLDYLLGGLE